MNEPTRESILHAEVSAGDDDAWPPSELLEVHELNELGAGIEPVEQSLSSMTKAELAEVAAEAGVELPSKATKADIIAALDAQSEDS